MGCEVWGVGYGCEVCGMGVRYGIKSAVIPNGCEESV